LEDKRCRWNEIKMDPNEVWCLQKFPDWPTGARTANGTALCHWVQFYRYFVSQ